MMASLRPARNTRNTRPPGPIEVPAGLPAWAARAYEDIVASSRSVASEDLVDEFAEKYLRLSGAEECCWPARAYWRELGGHMGPARRGRLALSRLWPEYLRFRAGRRSAACTDMRRLLLAGGSPHGLDCVHAARCEHCRMFSIYIGT